MIKGMIQTDAHRGAATANLPEKPGSTPFFICISVGRVIHVVNYMFSRFCSIKHDVVRYDFRVTDIRFVFTSIVL
jgi:ankyrin repeat protein